MMSPTVALVGGHGYGALHLRHLTSLAAEGVIRLVGVADPRPGGEEAGGDGIPWFTSLEQLLAVEPSPRIVVVATPPHTHADVALLALSAGADVYVEKPPVATWAQFEQLQSAAARADRVVQVGFQSLGSESLEVIATAIADGEIGDILDVSAEGTWTRTRGYFQRSRWAGRRTLEGRDVTDGVATNPLAHAVVTALRVAGARRGEDVATVETDLYRAHDIDSDDTSVLRVRTASGVAVTLALTLCAQTQTAPVIRVRGTRGSLLLRYTLDKVTIAGVREQRTLTTGRVNLLQNLIAHRVTGDPLLSPLTDSGAFMRVVEAVRTADAPRPIPEEWLTWTGEGDDRRPVVRDIERTIQRAVAAQATFAEIGVPWAAVDGVSDVLAVDGATVAGLRDGSVAASSSPRPYLHPVSTLEGVVVTDHLPTDHVWHLGAGFAVQDVAGWNFWGGRTYTREDGYVWRADHGRIALDRRTRAEGRVVEDLTWHSPVGPVLVERREWSAAASADGWSLSFGTELRPAAAASVSLGSPGSNGRRGGGYGGFFWRMAPCSGIHVRTEDHAGEDAVHGTVSRWLAWSADFEAGPATIVFATDHVDDADPWFVRVAGYPGVGLSLAWDRPVIVQPEAPLRRHVRVLVADGRLQDAEIRRFAESPAAADLH